MGLFFCFLAVAFGAFGAHALKAVLLNNGREATFELANRYHFFHALALIIVSSLAGIEQRWFKFGSVSLTCGLVVFSGSLYLLSVTNQTWLGAITPIGGVGLLLGWLFFIVGVLRSS